MAEPQQPSPQPAATPAAPAAPASPEPKVTPLEKVYSDFNVEAEAATFQPQSPQPAAQPVAPVVQVPAKFDPFDPNFPAHLAGISKAAMDAQSALQQTQGQLTALQRQLHNGQVEADIKSAVKTLAEKANIDPDIAEVAFQAQAKKDPRLLHIWNNRGKNPKALEAALNALGTEFAQKYAVRQDPQLVENQRAVAASRQTMATTQKTSDADEWAAMTPNERQAKVQLLLRQGGR